MITKAYCINLAERTDRRRIVTQCARSQGIELTFIEAVTSSDPEIDRRLHGKDPKSEFQSRSEYACILSHLKALRAVAEGNDEVGLILEDDPLFRSDFQEELAEVRKLWDSVNYPLLLLSPFFSSEEGCKMVTGRTPQGNSLMTIGPNVWVVCAYLVTKKGARELLDKYDKPFSQLPTPITSEIILLRSGRELSVQEPLVTEICVNDSSIRPGISINKWRVTHWSNYWKYRTFDWPKISGFPSQEEVIKENSF